MPHINLGKKYNPVKTNHVKEYQEFYNTPVWKNLRRAKFLANPVCEICETKGIVRVTDEVHHKKPWNQGMTLAEKWELFLEWENLQSLCIPCHHIEDDKLRK